MFKSGFQAFLEKVDLWQDRPTWKPPEKPRGGWSSRVSCFSSDHHSFRLAASPATEPPAPLALWSVAGSEVVCRQPQITAELGPAPDLTVVFGLYHAAIHAFLNQIFGGQLRTKSQEVAWNCRLAKRQCQFHGNSQEVC